MRVRRGVLMAATLAAVAAWNAPFTYHQYTEGIVGSAAAAPARAPDGVNFQAFHDRLAPYGQWMNDPHWGAVWRPNIRKGFWPYRQGHWDITRDYGTVWISDYPWGDIPFHFGRWFYDPMRGWLWVPGYVWGPAWVVWRAGEGKVGWLPMPPWINYDGNGEFPDDWTNGYGYADFDVSPSRFYSLWCFVDAADLYAPSIDYYVIGPGYNARFIDRTAAWTRYSVYHGHVFNLSIDPVRFRTAFGLRMHVQRRNDSDRLGPIVDYAAGRRIEAREHGMISRPPEAGRPPFPAPVKAPPESPGTHVRPHHPVPVIPRPAAPKPAGGEHPGHAIPVHKSVVHIPPAPASRNPVPAARPSAAPLPPAAPLHVAPAPAVHAPVVHKPIVPVHAPAPAQAVHAPAAHPMIHAPVVHPAVTKGVPQPHVYTHTEVVPYHPTAPSHPVAVPQKRTAPAAKAAHPGSAPPKGASPGKAVH